MNKEEFKLLCHEFFVQKGFKKRNKMYYLKGKELLCGIYMQKSIADAYYVEYNYFIGDFDNPKQYPKRYEKDLNNRITVLSKTTCFGKYYMDAGIEYEKYSEDEIIFYFEKAFEKEVMPPLLYGKQYLIDNFDFYFRESFYKEKLKAYAKLTNGKVLYED